jgi:hypothetical protein
MFQIKVVEKIKTQILCSIIFFFPENRAVYNVEKCDGARGPQMTSQYGAYALLAG